MAKTTLIFCMIVVSVFTLHLNQHLAYDQQKYLDALQSQQQKLKEGIKKLSASIDNADKALAEAQLIQKKISLLEDAITNEDDQVFAISTDVIPPLNLAMCNCQAISKQNKQSIILAADSTLSKIKDFQQQIDSLKDKDNDPRVKEIKRNLKNQIYYLENMKKIVESNCTLEAQLQPTVYQSNVYAKNWILGTLTIDNLIKAYVERSMKYNSVTNCQMDKPFFDNSACIHCQHPNPVFNMQTLKCVTCPQGTQINNDKKACVSNITPISNILTKKPWVATEGKVSQVIKQFSNNLQTIKNDKKHVLCQVDAPFVIDGQCSKCSYAYFYSLEDKKCIQLPDKKQYDSNIHQFITPQTNKETLPTAQKLLSKGVPTDNPQIPNCPESKPYFDDIACIACPLPFQLFQISSKRCKSCNPQEFYNKESRSCQNRKIIYKNANNTNLLGTPKSPISDYSKKIQDSIKNNNDGIILDCPKGQNSLLTSCIKCKDNQWFSTSTFKCIQCAQIDGVNKNCLDGVKYLTNSAAKNKLIGDSEGYFKKNQQQLKTNSQAIVCQPDKPFSNGKQCKNCNNPTPLFSIDNLQCTACPKSTKYDEKKSSCEKVLPTEFTNLKAKNLLAQNTKAVQDYIQDQKKKSTSQNPKQCEDPKPYFNNKQCIQCTNDKPLFNIQTNQCSACPQKKVYDETTFVCSDCIEGTKYSSQTKTCQKVKNPNASNPMSFGKIIFAEGATQDKYKLKEGDVACQLNKPFFNGLQCIQCQENNNLFDIQNKKCTKCPQQTQYNPNTHKCEKKSANLPNFFNSKSTDKIIVTNPQDLTKKQGAVECPQNTPFFDGVKCIQCQTQEKPLFDLSTKSCANCLSETQYNTNTHKCEKKSANLPNFFNSKSTDKIIVTNPQDLTKKQGAVECPQNTPFFDGVKCIQCQTQEKPLFDLSTKSCANCLSETQYNTNTHKCEKKSANLPNFFNSKSTDKIIVTNPQDLTKKQGAVECPQNTPFFDGVKCIQCQTQEKPLFDLSTKSCANCLSETQYNTNTHKCEKKSANLPNFFNSKSTDKIIVTNPQDLTKKQGAVECPQNTPFFDGVKCIQCQTQEKPLFDLSTKSCANCLSETQYNTNTHKCEKKSANLPNFFNSKSTDKIIVTNPQDLTKKQGAVECPQNTPFFDGVKCIQCQTQEKPLFDLSTKSCANCPSETQYNTNTHKCQVKKLQVPKFVSKLRDTNWIAKDPASVISSNNDKISSGLKQCSIDKPFLVGTVCQSCQFNKYFNIDTSNCQQCPSNLKYNNLKHQCLQPPSFITNPSTAPKLIYGGYSSQQLKAQYIKDKSKYSQIKNCPQQKPYFNGQQCIVCTGTLPYFNLVSKKCQTCPEGSEYNQKQFQCINKATGQPQNTSFNRFIADIFSHQQKSKKLYNLHRIKASS